MSPSALPASWPNDWARNLCIDSGPDDGTRMLLFSGLAVSGYTLRPIAEACGELPLRLRLRSLPGHCGDADAFREISIEQTLKEGEAALEAMATPGEPILLGGFSGGAVLSMCLAARRPDLVRALFLIGYCPRIKGLKRSLLVTSCGVLDKIAVVRKFLRRKSFRVKESGARGVMDPRYREQPRFSCFTGGAFAMLSDLQREAAAACRRVRVPVHFFHGAKDERADVRDVLKIHKGFQTRAAPEPRVYEHSPHCVLFGPEAELFGEDFAGAVACYL